MVQALRLPLSCPFVLIASCPGFYRHARSHYGFVFSWWRTKQLAVIAAELGRAFIAHLVAKHWRLPDAPATSGGLPAGAPASEIARALLG